MKKIFVSGNVGKDPETRHLANGGSFVTFSLAVKSGTKDNPKTDWVEINCNNKLAEIAQQYVKKGTKLLVEGTPNANAYIDKEGKAVAKLVVYANNLELMGGGEKEHSTEFNAPSPTLQTTLQSDAIPF